MTVRLDQTGQARHFVTHAMPADATPTVPLLLSKAQALVLFEFLSAFSEQESLEIRDEAERRVLWDVLADLESALSEPLAGDYQQQLQKARESLRDSVV